ncbi:MAG: hypothetical protein V4577_13835 [Bacteroidota bacterium]
METIRAHKEAYPGYKIIASVDQKGIYCTLFKRDVNVRALWTQESLPAPPRQAHFLFEEKGHRYYEAAGVTGRLIKTPAASPGSTTGKKLEDMGFSASLSPRYGSGRSILADPGHRYIAGFARNVNGINLKQVFYQLTPVKNNWDLQRHFVLEGRLDFSRMAAPQAASRQTAEMILDTYLANPVVIRGSYHIGRNTVMLYPDDPFFGKENWYSSAGQSFPVGTGREALISEANYDRENAEFFLYRSGRTVYADLKAEQNFRLPERFQKEYNRRRKDERFFPLYFIAKRTLAGQPEQAGYLFEWGYGKHLWIPEAQLYVNHKPAVAEPEIFYGDKVYEVDFLKKAVRGVETLVINIRSFQIDYNDTSLLYLQRKNQRMIHVLTIEKTSQREIRIKQVMGFSEKDTRETYYFKTKQPRFNLSDDQAVAIIKRFDTLSASELKVYGRIDLPSFKKENRLTFDLVDMGRADNAGGIKTGERIPLLAKRKVAGKNDTLLFLNPLDTASGPAELPDIPMTRRQFSVRENLLKKLAQQDIAGKVYFVTLRTGDRGLYASLTDAPARKNKVLRDLVRYRGVVQGIVNVADEQKLVIELKPGVHIRLLPQEFEFREKAGCARGDRLYIEQLPGTEDPYFRFRISLASSGDRAFVSATARPCVLLPKNQLSSKRDFQGKKPADILHKLLNEVFTVGGLPNIAAGMGNRESEDAVREFMARNHPKAALLVLEKGQVRIRLDQRVASGGLLVGQLDYSLQASLSGTADPVALAWESISFAACGVRELTAIIREAAWEYHDSHTIRWVFDAGQISGISEQELRTQGSVKGPLFFDPAPGGYRLRFDSRDFSKYGFPVDVLIEDLERRPGKNATYTFAGQSADGRYWVEISPGRIAEFTPKLVSFKTPTKLHLEKFNWRNLSVGDQLALVLPPGDPTEPEEITFTGWTPASRDVLLKQGCIASASHTNRGELLVGAGLYQLKVPTMTLLEGFQGVIALNETNEIRMIDPAATALETLTAGTTVFLDGDLYLSGFPDVRAQADHAQQWKDDPLYAILFPANGFSGQQFGILARLLGGAVPVTVTRITEEDGRATCYFNRKHQFQKAFIQDQEIALARAVGLFRGGELLMKCGNQLFLMNLDEFVPGFPRLFASQLLQLLTRRDAWFRKVGQQLCFGFQPEGEDAEIRAEITGVLADPNHAAISGLVCRSTASGRFYWIPATHLAWTPIAPGLLKTCFPPGSFVKVKLLPDAQGKVIGSIVGTNEALNEFKRFQVGSELAVRSLRKEKMGTGLVKTLGSGMILQCQVPETTNGNNRWLVVVIEKSDAAIPFYLVARQGARTYRLDLPPTGTYDEKVQEQYTHYRNTYQYASAETICRRFEDCLEIAASAAAQVDGPDSEERLFIFYEGVSRFREQLTADQLACAAAYAGSYIRQNQQQPAISLSFGILAVLLLQEASLWLPDSVALARQAAGFTREICARALRSAHVPLVMGKLAEGPMRDIDAVATLAGPHNIYVRLMSLKQKLQKPELDSQELLEIISFCGLIAYRQKEKRQDLEVLANALLAAAGYPADTGMILDNNPVHGELLKLYAVFIRHGEQMQLMEQHLDILKNILEQTIAFPVILLDNLLPAG